jgi:3-oxoacyl-[acyl-carrier-protein] synthase II
MSKRRVVITGMGTVNPLGHNVAEMWEAMLEGRSGISPIEIFEADTYPTTFAAQVRNFELADHIADADRHAKAGRHTRFALAAARQAWKQAKLDDDAGLDLNRVGIYLGCGEGGLLFEKLSDLVVRSLVDDQLDPNLWYDTAWETMDVYEEVEQESNMVAAHLAGEFNITGPAFNVLTACAASTQAIGEATCQVRRGSVDVLLTGGAHSMIHASGLTGFSRLTALSRRNDDLTTASRPFDMTRDGFVLGEGASVLMIEEYERAKARGATILAEIVGYGASADAFRMTDQDPEGEGAAAAMRNALADAGMTPEAIDYVSAHGTGTKQNDQVETLAIKAVFGDDPATVPPTSSVKSMLGHLIAAAGATELITCILALHEQILPPTINQHSPDPDCNLDYVPNTPRSADVKVCMSNSMGFGGQNNTLILTQPS